MTAAVVAPASVPRPIEGKYRRVLAALGAAARRGLRVRLRCLILGHEDSFARQPRRLMLRCATCGRETAGWAIGPGAPTAAVATPYSRLAVAPGPRVRPRGLGLRLWRGRAEARDRERQRMVQAAARAAEPHVEGVGRGEPARERSQPRRLAGEQPDGWMDVARRVRAGLGG